MADVITRLKLETTQYDSKLRDASKGLSDFAREASKAGNDFQKLAEGNMESARAFGNIANSATNSKDKLKELVSAYNDVAKAYNGLTQEQQQSDFGKALVESLDKLKARIADTKQELQNVGSEMKATKSEGDSLGGMLNDIAGKFGLNITRLGSMGAAIGATSAALKVAKDAFFSNEELLDEWGRTIDTSESAYRGFLDALNTGDISGYLNKIDTIASAARQAYDTLDNLATFNAFNQVNVARKRQAFMDAQNDYREGTGSKERVKSAGEAVKGELEQRRQFEKKAYSAEIVKYAQERGVNPVDLARAMLGASGDYNKIKSLPLTGTKTEIKTNMYGQQWTQTTKVAANEMERMGAMLRRFNDDELKYLQGLGAQFFNTGFEKGQIDRQVSRIVNGRSGAGSTGGGSTSIGSGKTGTVGGRSVGGGSVGGGTQVETPAEKAEKTVASALLNYQKTISMGTMRFESGMINSEQLKQNELQAQERLAMAYAEAYNIYEDEKYKDAFSNAAIEFNNLADVVKGKREKFDEATKALMGMSVNPIDSRLSGLLSESMEGFANRKGLNIDTSNLTKGAKEVKEGWQDAAKAVQSVGGALQQLEDPGAKVAGIIGEAIANIALGFAQATAASSPGGPFAWIAAIAGGLGTMLSTIAAIKSATAGSYAEGGIIPGNNYNDGLIANVSSGELILNRAQQNSIAGQLTAIQGDNDSKPYVDVETIWLGMGNYLKRKGKGEIVTSR